MKPFPARPRGMDGFTLLELVVVLAIAILVLTVTPPLLSSAMPGLQLKSSAREVAAAMRYARGRAVAQRTQVLLSVDLETRRLQVEGAGRSIRLSPALSINLVGAASEMQDENHGGIRFYPDGSSTGGRITLSHNGSGFDVDLDWLTGRVDIRSIKLPSG